MTTLCPCSWQTKGPPLSFCSGRGWEQTIREISQQKNWTALKMHSFCFVATTLTSHTPSPLLPPAHILLGPASPLICEHMSLWTIGMVTAFSVSSYPVSEQMCRRTKLLNVKELKKKQKTQQWLEWKKMTRVKEGSTFGFPPSIHGAVGALWHVAVFYREMDRWGTFRHRGRATAKKERKKKDFTPMRPFLSNTLKVNVRFYFTELTPLVSAWPGWILPGRRSDERCAVWGVWRIRWDAAGRPARCNPSNLERWNAAETTKCKFTIYIIAGLGVCSCPKAGTALWEKKSWSILKAFAYVSLFLIQQRRKARSRFKLFLVVGKSVSYNMRCVCLFALIPSRHITTAVSV